MIPPIQISIEINLGEETLAALRHIYAAIERNTAAKSIAEPPSLKVQPAPAAPAPIWKQDDCPRGAAFESACCKNYTMCRERHPLALTEPVTVSRPSWKTAERDAVLSRMYPQGDRHEAITEELMRLPGGPLPEWASVRTHAIQTLKLKRPQNAPVDPPAPVIAPPALTWPPDRIPTTSPSHWATEARKSVLRQMYPRGDTPEAIVEELEYSKGPPLPNWDTIRHYALEALKLHRPDTTFKPGPKPLTRLEALQRSSAAATARPVKTPGNNGKTPVRMDAHQLLRWAGDRGVPLHLPISEADVQAVNAKAKEIGWPPIEYMAPRRSVSA